MNNLYSFRNDVGCTEGESILSTNSYYAYEMIETMHKLEYAKTTLDRLAKLKADQCKFRLRDEESEREIRSRLAYQFLTEKRWIVQNCVSAQESSCRNNIMGIEKNCFHRIVKKFIAEHGICFEIDEVQEHERPVRRSIEVEERTSRAMIENAIMKIYELIDQAADDDNSSNVSDVPTISATVILDKLIDSPVSHYAKILDRTLYVDPMVVYHDPEDIVN